MARLVSLAAVAVPLVLAGLATPAQAEIWCLRDFGSSQRTCVFVSAHDCVRAAVIGGGACERDTAVQNRPARKNGRRGEREPVPQRQRSFDAWAAD